LFAYTISSLRSAGTRKSLGRKLRGGEQEHAEKFRSPYVEAREGNPGWAAVFVK